MTEASFRAKHGLSRLLHAYADFRIGATEAEKRCFKPSDSILLTFDDYGTEEEVTDLLSILSNKHVKAIFFLIGSWAEQNAALVKKIGDAGHVLGNHTYTHADLLRLPDNSITHEIKSGIPGRWLRAPKGRYNAHIRRIAEQNGYSLCYWTIDTNDWAGTSVAEMRNTVLKELHPGAVILMHINGKHTREMLPGLIDDIRSRGYTLTSFDENW